MQILLQRKFIASSTWLHEQRQGRKKEISTNCTAESLSNWNLALTRTMQKLISSCHDFQHTFIAILNTLGKTLNNSIFPAFIKTVSLRCIKNKHQKQASKTSSLRMPHLIALSVPLRLAMAEDCFCTKLVHQKTIFVSKLSLVFLTIIL